MKAQAPNSLEVLQKEFIQLKDQTAILYSQLPILSREVDGLLAYVSLNTGDRVSMNRYRHLKSNLTQMTIQIKRNENRLIVLQTRINEITHRGVNCYR